MTIDLIAQAQASVEQGLVQDMTEVQASSGGRLLPQGNALVRFTGYIELGTQKQPDYQGKPKAPQPVFVLQVHIVGGKGVDENGERVPYVEDGKHITQYSKELTIKTGDLARAAKIFKAFKGTKPVTSFVQLLGSTYIIPVVHSKGKKDPNKTYANLDWEKATVAIDPTTGDDLILDEVAPSEYKVLLWNAPTQQQWDSIFIDGEWQAKDDKPAQSKNRWQLRCYEATDFAGSALEAMLGGDSLPSISVPNTPEEPAEIPDVPEA